MRKLIIGLVAVGFVVLLFVMYALIMDAKPIEAPYNNAEADTPEVPEFDRTVQQEGDTTVRAAEEGQYVIFDKQTGQISRIFGFEKLLSRAMNTSRRQVEKPYMIFYDPDYECRIDADMGTFQMETVGAGATPKDAQLSGNVIIHVTPKTSSGRDEILVEMDDVVFSSERSEFATDRRVHIKSNQMELRGTGLVVIFDPDNGKINYLRIRDLDQIRMQGVADSKSSGKTKTKAVESSANTVSVIPKPEPENNVIADSSIETGSNNEDKIKESQRYFQCLLEDNVNIKYGNEIIVSGAEQINIQNILFDNNESDTRTLDQTDSKPKKIQKPNEVSGNNNPPVNKGQTEPKTESITEVTVTCDGGIILQPMKDENAGQEPVTQSVIPEDIMSMPLRTAVITPDSQHTPVVTAINLVGEQDVTATAKPAAMEADKTVLVDSPPAKFEARKIDYNLLTGSGLAHGPVRFTFYQSSDPNSPTSNFWIPITVTADENAQFIADSSQTIKQVVFNGNVMTTRETETPDFVQFDKLHSEKLTVDLDEISAGKTDLSRLTVTEGKVYVESLRTQGEQDLSRVKLYCTQISYDKVDDVILAQGPGKIEMVNTQESQTADSDSNNPMSGPCVAVVDNFTAIHWNIGRQSIVANGDQDAMKLAYYPISDGIIQKRTFVHSMQLELNYLPGASGVKSLYTNKPIVYEEWNGGQTKRLHRIVGGKLDYNAVEGDGWITISGTPAMPCRLDNVPMEKVLVHPITGEIKAPISTTPGILKRR